MIQLCLPEQRPPCCCFSPPFTSWPPLLVCCCLCSNGRDPRFDEVLHPAKPGDKDAAAKRYSFLYDEVLPQEKAALKQRLKVGPCCTAGMYCCHTSVVCGRRWGWGGTTWEDNLHNVPT